MQIDYFVLILQKLLPDTCIHFYYNCMYMYVYILFDFNQYLLFC